MEKKAVLSSLSALAQETRLDIFRALVQNAPAGMKPGELVETLVIAPATLSFHLKEMSHAGLVNVEQQGRSLIYRANFGTMNGLVDYLTENCCSGNACSPGKPC